jgi:hypothetical protein
MQLAREFGNVNVDEFLENVSSQQLAEWIALRDLEPWGEELFYRFLSKCFARVCCAMGLKTAPTDLMPEFYKGDAPHYSGLMDFQTFKAAVTKGD